MDLNKKIKDSWLEKAAIARTELEKLPAWQRSKFIEKNSNLWRELRPLLIELSHDKCWYSEDKLPDACLEVDHFRPKNRISEAKDHSGYWWLSFDWKNFRIASPVVNKRRTDHKQEKILGKGCFFPLLEEKHRVSNVSQWHTNCEEPALIDPCVKSDVLLLDYSVEDGLIVERSGPEDHTNYQRAKTSIDLYHLNEGTLNIKRMELHATIKHLGDWVEKLWAKKATRTITAEEENDMANYLNSLGDLVHPSSAFATFARASLMQRGHRGWNDALLETV